MNKEQYLAALRQALEVLPPEERDSAVAYYEDYFADAGPENEQKVIEELGTPTMVAHAILAEYRELATVPQSGAGTVHSVPQGAHSAKKGISPWLLVLLVLLAIPLGVPLLSAAVAVIAGFLSVVLVLALVTVLVPVICVGVGVAVCWAGLVALFVSPASGLYAIGGGLVSIAIGLLIGLLFAKLLMLFVPPVVRGFVNLCRRPFERRNFK